MKNVKSGHTRPIVTLDAGHYGKYNRSPVVPEYWESVMTWALHNYLATELQAYGIQVKKTRTDQAKDLSTSARGRASKGSDLFISVHSNACNSERVDRPVGIYLVDDNCSTIDEQSRQVATLLAETVREVMQTNDKAQAYSRLSDRDRDGDGRKNDDYYGVLFAAHQVGTAGIILEHSFHTNTRAAKWMLADANLRKLAKAEAATIAAWFDVAKTGSSSSGSSAAPAEPEEKPQLAKIKLDYAQDKDTALKGTYVVQSSDGCLNLRAGASAKKALIETMKNGTKVRCYGWHTGDWLYVVSASNNVGFCHKAYLKKV